MRQKKIVLSENKSQFTSYVTGRLSDVLMKADNGRRDEG